MRRVDTMVAIHLFGASQAEWNGEPGHWFVPHSNGNPDDRMHLSCVDRRLMGHNVRQSDGLPKFSENMDAAWVVVEKMQDHLPSLMYRCGDGPPFNKMRWTCEFRRDFVPGHWKGAAMDTAPLAICVAALKAVGVPESEITAAMEGERP